MGVTSDRRVRSLLSDEASIREAFHRESRQEGIFLQGREFYSHNEYGRIFLRFTEALELRHTPPHEQEVSWLVLRGARFRLQCPEDQRRPAHRQSAQGCPGQALNAEAAKGGILTLLLMYADILCSIL